MANKFKIGQKVVLTHHNIITLYDAATSKNKSQRGLLIGTVSKISLYGDNCFIISQPIVWVKNYLLECWGTVELKNKLEKGLLTGKVKEVDKYGRCFIIFDEDLRWFLKRHYSTDLKQVKENGLWLHPMGPNYKIRPLNGIELMVYKAKSK